MARIAAGLISQIWAENPSSADDVIAPSDARQETGWDNPFFQPGGSLPQGEHANWLFRRHSAFGYDVSRHGLLEWSADQDYEHPAAVLASNNHLYLSVANSGPNMTGGAVNPTGATGTTRWRLAGSSNQFVPAARVTGTADAILLAPDPAFTVYAVGQTLIFRAEGDSTAGVTVNVSGLGAQALHFSDSQAGAGDIMNGFFYTIRYDGTNFIIVAESGFHILPVARGGTGVGSIADLLAALNIGNRLIPDGGTDGQVLTKDSGANYDVAWQDPAAGGLQTLTEGDHVSITGTGDTREIAVDTGTTQGDIAVLGTGGRFAAARVPEIQNLDGSLAAGDIPNLETLNGTLDIASGGTGSTTAGDARSALGLGSAAVEDVGTTQGDIPVLQASGLLDPDRVPNLQNLNGTLDVGSGGTGATDAAGARTAFGLGTAATRDTGTDDDNLILVADADARYASNPRTLIERSGNDTDIADWAAFADLYNALNAQSALSGLSDGDYVIARGAIEFGRSPSSGLLIYAIERTANGYHIHGRTNAQNEVNPSRLVVISTGVTGQVLNVSDSNSWQANNSIPGAANRRVNWWILI